MNRIERIVVEEAFVQLAADAIERQHPAADWLVLHGRIGQTGLTDAAIAAAVERLQAWLREQGASSAAGA